MATREIFVTSVNGNDVKVRDLHNLKRIVNHLNRFGANIGNDFVSQSITNNSDETVTLSLSTDSQNYVFTFTKQTETYTPQENVPGQRRGQGGPRRRP
jgi:DhnA family fructose-bisphosphate aldolase class Ia